MAVKVALEAFKGIVTVAGTTRAGTLELSPTATAAFVEALKLTVQVLVPPEDRELGAHATEVRVGGGAMGGTTGGAAIVMLPPVAATGMAYPAGDAPRVPATAMGNEVAVGASTTLTTATLPSGITFELIPVARHV